MDGGVSNKRITYYDIAKGFLIIGVIFYHCANNVADKNSITKGFQLILSVALIPFFMIGFFFISGLCTNLNKSLSSYICKSIRTMIFPTYVITIGMMWYPFEHVPNNYGLNMTNLIWYCNGAWFIASMLTCRLLLWVIKHTFKNKFWIEIPIVIAFLMIGTFLVQNKIVHNETNNWFYYCQSMLLFPFFYFGYHFKKGIQCLKRKTLCILMMFYAIFLFSVYYMYHSIPIVTHYLSLNFKNFLWYVLLGLLGSVCLVGICKLYVKKKPVMEYVGKNSLILYLVHGQILQYITLCLQFNSNRNSIFSLIALCLSTTIISLLIAWWLNLPYIRILLGQPPCGNKNTKKD